ncbi:MAG: hypothetical protein ACJ8D5_09600 [Sphingomicrobium sp.]
MKTRIACSLLLCLSTAAWAGPRYGNYMSGTPTAAWASGQFEVCEMGLWNGPSFRYMEVPCVGAHV